MWKRDTPLATVAGNGNLHAAPISGPSPGSTAPLWLRDAIGSGIDDASPERDQRDVDRVPVLIIVISIIIRTKAKDQADSSRR